MTRSRTLLAELKAIDAWDVEYRRETVHDRTAIDAFESRQIRRKEILDLLKMQTGDKQAST
jgi:hypothetical protein